MTKTTSNIGLTGPESIRVGGMTIDNLPIAEGAHAAMQMPEVFETDRQNKIEGIKASYPKPSVAYIDGRIREARSNIKRFREEVKSTEDQRTEYSSHIAIAKMRDREIAAIPADDPDRKDKVADLNQRMGYYQVDALEQQIGQFNESLERLAETIDAEHDSIAELSELRAECVIRDKELKRLGA